MNQAQAVQEVQWEPGGGTKESYTQGSPLESWLRQALPCEGAIRACAQQHINQEERGEEKKGERR